MKRILFLLLLALSQSPLYAVSFDMNDTALEIYEDIFSFKLVSAKQKAKEAIEDDKDNLVYEFLHLSANYFDLVNLPNDSKIESFSKEEDQVLENLKKLSDTEPFKKYAISDIYFHTAMFKMTQGDYLSGANLIRKANKLLEENKKAHPDFLINNKNYSLIKILVGSIPKKYRFIESLAGIDGDAPKGVRMLASVGFNEINAKFKYIQKESKLLYAIALFTIENNKELSFRIVKQECADYKTNLFSNYIYAIHATMQGENDLVLSLLNQKPKYNELEIHYMDYMKGLAQLRKLDFTAIKTFKRYLETAESSYNKYNAYKHLYWAYKLKGEESNAKLYKDKAKKEREDKFEGDFDFDANYYNKRLLEIRLLYDGGYYAQAKLKIKKISLSSLGTTDKKLEYYYRYGRIYQGLGDESNALYWLKKAVDTGVNSTRYFGRKAALESGIIYKEQEIESRAKEMLTKAIDSFPNSEEHEKSIKQQAKMLKSEIE